jgi:triacylglycerol lipase
LTAAHFQEASPPGGVLDVQLEAVASNFEVQRAIDAYIPLLTACYSLAHQQPFQFPRGYSSIGEIRTDATEMALMEGVESPEVREAVMNDLEATEAAVADPSAFGFVILEEKTGSVLVCIRGTQTPREWRANFTAVPNPFSLAPDYGLVHLGFEMMHRSVSGSIAAALRNVGPNARVTVIGHSLGGAMATLAAVDIKRNLGRQVDVCTFGSPRVGKFIFRSKFNSEIPICYRVTNRGDIVPHVPTMLTGWTHVGEEIEVDGAVENDHSLAAHLEGLRNIGSIRELVIGGGLETPMPRVMGLRAP